MRDISNANDISDDADAERVGETRAPQPEDDLDSEGIEFKKNGECSFTFAFT